MKKHSNEGGCWFCHDDGGEMMFSWEFDCYLHEACLKKALEGPFNPEAEIIAKEFDITFESKWPDGDLLESEVQDDG
jgi:lambda repressor-like predicted transcriptional regulator